jgi:hypothetical protein
MYAYIDGDDIGLKIENSFMNNDEIRLKEINESVKEIVREITDYLNENNYKIIFSGADGIICKREKIDVKQILEFIRMNSKEIRFSIGAGNSLNDSFLALRYAKSCGKNIAAIFDNGFKLLK